MFALATAATGAVPGFQEESAFSQFCPNLTFRQVMRTTNLCDSHSNARILVFFRECMDSLLALPLAGCFRLW
jgi:hypothetical protein